MIFDDLSDVRAGLPLSSWPVRFLDYFRSRGVTEEQIEKWGLGFVEKGALAERVFVPIADEDGALRMYAARSILPEHNVPPPYPPKVSRARWSYSMHPIEFRDPVWFGQRFWTGGKDRAVVVVEGVFDALRLDREFPGISVAAYHLTFQPQAAFDAIAFRFGKVVVMTDSDPAGERLAGVTEKGVATSGSGVPVVRARLTSKDPAAASLSELREVLGASGVV